MRVGDQKETDREWIMPRRDQVAQRGEPARALRHLLPRRVGQELGMQPDAREGLVVGSFGLRDLVLVMREHEIHAPRVDVQRVAEVALAHRGALDVPPRAPAPERSVPCRPELFVLRMRLLPQCEIAHRLLVVLVGGDPRAGLQPGAVEVRQGAVLREAGDPEVHITVGDVCVFVLDESRDHVDHLGDVLRGAWVVLGTLGPERSHVLEKGRLVRFDVFRDRRARVHRLVQDPVVDVGEVHHVRGLVPSDVQVPSH